MLSLADIFDARRRIAGLAIETPLIPSPHLSRVAGQEFLLKLELAQPTGAFKLRGAANAVASLPATAPGVVCASTGNHGRALAYAAQARGVPATICMSRLVPAVKRDAIAALGAEIRTLDTQDDAEIEAARIAAAEGVLEISAFDDPQVIAGQGTIGLELLSARPDLETLLIPLSGGGLAGGIALAAKTIKPSIRVIGLTMDRGPAMHLSMTAGHPVPVVELPSLADALGGSIGTTNRHSLDLCRRYLDDSILVTEAEIYHALQALYHEDRLVAEGSCVVGIAALLAGKLPALNGPVATILTGRNIDPKRHAAIMRGETIRLGDLVLEGVPYAA
ncbi:MAG: hydroxyectoine utilization dehydratase EutB [Pseudomonadota bacterium]